MNYLGHLQTRIIFQLIHISKVQIRDGSIFKSNLYGDTSIDTIIGQINGINNELIELNELYELIIKSYLPCSNHCWQLTS